VVGVGSDATGVGGSVVAGGSDATGSLDAGPVVDVGAGSVAAVAVTPSVGAEPPSVVVGEVASVAAGCGASVLVVGVASTDGAGEDCAVG
jgi:hypothetical protein